jgi:hypothetical protein
MTKDELYLLYITSSFLSQYKLSKARLVKMLYLADWKNCLIEQKQITDVKWYYNHFGPYVMELQTKIENSRYFKIESIMENEVHKDFITSNVIEIGKVFEKINPKEKEILNFVIENTKNLNWKDFIKLVYSTYPIMKQPRYTYLDLPSLAIEYIELKKVTE